jgi:hypothetical protein
LLFLWILPSPEAASPSKLKSPAKPRHAVVGDDGEPIFSPYGDLLPTRTLKDTASLVSEYSDRPSASTRDFTRVSVSLTVFGCHVVPLG